MKTLTLTTYLEAPPSIIREHVMTPALLNYVVAGLMRFKPVEPRCFPHRWQAGQYKVKMVAFHVLPIGWQIVGIELPNDADDWFVRDNGSGAIARTWDHLIFIDAEGGGSRYTDKVSIDADWLTPVITLYARLFYAYRQMRWRRLVRLQFAPLAH